MKGLSMKTGFVGETEKHKKIVEQVRRVLLWNAHRKFHLPSPSFWEEFDKLVDMYDETFGGHVEYTGGG